MTQDDIKGLDQETLLNKQKSLTTSTSVLAGVLIVLFIATIYSSIREQTFDPLLVIPLAFSSILLRNYRILKWIKAEQKNRMK